MMMIMINFYNDNTTTTKKKTERNEMSDEKKWNKLEWAVYGLVLHCNVAELLFGAINVCVG